MTAPHDPDAGWDPEREEAASELRRDDGQRRWWLVGGLGVVVMSALAVWFGLAATEDPVVVKDIGFERPSDREVVMVFDVTREPGTVLSCTVTAMDTDYGRVGTTEQEVPASSEETTRVRATVRTTTTAATATADSCREVE